MRHTRLQGMLYNSTNPMTTSKPPVSTFVCHMHQTFSQRSVCVTSEAEITRRCILTLHYNIKIACFPLQKCHLSVDKASERNSVTGERGSWSCKPWSGNHSQICIFLVIENASLSTACFRIESRCGCFYNHCISDNCGCHFHFILHLIKQKFVRGTLRRALPGKPLSFI